MPTYVSNRDSGSRTNEEGHYRFHVKVWDGEVLAGLTVGAQVSPNMTVAVAAGDCRIPYGEYAYTAWNDAAENVTISTADTSNTRIDAIVAYIDRGMSFTSSDTNNPGALKFKTVAGTPSSSPVVPTNTSIQTSVGGTNPWILLAHVTVAPNVTQITNINIADKRTMIRSRPSTLERMYPIGSIYINATDSTNPATLFGFGTWVAFGEGRVPVGKAASGTFGSIGAAVGSETHRHKGYADGDGFGNGDLRATIGAASGDAGSINYQALDPINPNTGGGLGNGTYAVNGTSAGNRSFSHYTKVVGYTSTNQNIQPSIVVYMWRRSA